MNALVPALLVLEPATANSNGCSGGGWYVVGFEGWVCMGRVMPQQSSPSSFFVTLGLCMGP